MANLITVKKTTFVTSIISLVAKYIDTFPGEAEELSLLQELLATADDSVGTRSHLPGHLTAGGLIVDWQQQAVLLVHHRFLKRWLQPGGHLEGTEDPSEAALRELEEEVGSIEIDLNMWHLLESLPLDIGTHQIPPSPEKSEPAHYHHDFLYLFDLVEPAEVNLKVDEVTDFRWVKLTDLRDGSYGQRLQRVARKIDFLGLVDTVSTQQI
jgi:8-oxo-dGTP pyrophosphatase MutT (NUDIX family)